MYSDKQKRRKSKNSDYGIQLQEKQKVRLTYGISEKQFKNIFKKASKMKGIHGENFLILLESRLDNIVYRLNIAKTRAQAKQLISHGHILVESKKVDICSYILKPGQHISISTKSRDLKFIQDSLKSINNSSKNKTEYISFDSDKMIGKYIRYPKRNEFLSNINEQLIVEFYNR